MQKAEAAAIAGHNAAWRQMGQRPELSPMAAGRPFVMKTSANPPATSKPKETESKLVVVADLGHLRAYRLEKTSKLGRSQWKLIEDRETNVTHHLSEDVTDQAGRVRKEPGVRGALSDGEKHELDLERRHRAVKAMAERLTELIRRENAGGCCFAADARINQLILDELDDATRAKIERNILANLSKLSPEELRERFCDGEQHYVPETRQTERPARGNKAGSPI
jgi:hypothetical protein